MEINVALFSPTALRALRSLLASEGAACVRRGDTFSAREYLHALDAVRAVELERVGCHTRATRASVR